MWISSLPHLLTFVSHFVLDQILMHPIGLPDHGYEMYDYKSTHVVAVIPDEEKGGDKVIGCVLFAPSDEDVSTSFVFVCVSIMMLAGCFLLTFVEYCRILYNAVLLTLCSLKNYFFLTLHHQQSPQPLVGRLLQMAVDAPFQGKGVGKGLVHFLINVLEKQSIKEVHLHSRMHAIKFYEKLGFETYGEVFVEADIDHMNMKRVL